jgi:hypothetical protein
VSNKDETTKSEAQKLKIETIKAIKENEGRDVIKFADLFEKLSIVLLEQSKLGRDKYSMPFEDEDFATWTSPTGIKYLNSEKIGLKADVTQYSSGLRLDISWSEVTIEESPAPVEPEKPIDTQPIDKPVETPAPIEPPTEPTPAPVEPESEVKTVAAKTSSKTRKNMV